MVANDESCGAALEKMLNYEGGAYFARDEYLIACAAVSTKLTQQMSMSSKESTIILSST